MFKFLVGFLVFLAWTGWVRHVYVCEIKQLCQQSVFVDSTVGGAAVLRIGRQGEIMGGGEQFAFDLASDHAEFSNGNRDFLRRIGRYLKADPSLILKITGLYTPSERNVPAGMYENLGLSRAALIRDSLVGMFNVKSRRVRITAQMAPETDPEAATPPGQPLGFRLLKNTVLLRSSAGYEFADMTFAENNFKYGLLAFTPTLPFVIYADLRKSHLQAYPGRTVRIIAYAAKPGPAALNVAQARAEAVRKYLSRTKGINADMTTDFKVAGKNAPPGRALTVQVLGGL